MIAYDGPARTAIIIVAGFGVLIGLAIVIGRMFDHGDVDPVFEDVDPRCAGTVEPPGGQAPVHAVGAAEIPVPADVISLDGYRALRPRLAPDEISLAAERALTLAHLPQKGDAS